MDTDTLDLHRWQNDPWPAMRFQSSFGLATIGDPWGHSAAPSPPHADRKRVRTLDSNIKTSRAGPGSWPLLSAPPRPPLPRGPGVHAAEDKPQVMCQPRLFGERSLRFPCPPRVLLTGRRRRGSPCKPELRLPRFPRP